MIKEQFYMSLLLRINGIGMCNYNILINLTWGGNTMGIRNPRYQIKLIEK